MSRIGPGVQRPTVPKDGTSPFSARSQLWGWGMLAALVVIGAIVYFQGVPRVPKTAWVHYHAEGGNIRSTLATDVMCRDGWVEFTNEEGRRMRAYAATVEYPE